MRYSVRVILDEEYEDIEADSKQEAFIIASDYAINGGTWVYEIKEVEE